MAHCMAVGRLRPVKMERGQPESAVSSGKVRPFRKVTSEQTPGGGGAEKEPGTEAPGGPAEGGKPWGQAQPQSRAKGRTAGSQAQTVKADVAVLS